MSQVMLGCDICESVTVSEKEGMSDERGRRDYFNCTMFDFVI